MIDRIRYAPRRQIRAAPTVRTTEPHLMNRTTRSITLAIAAFAVAACQADRTTPTAPVNDGAAWSPRIPQALALGACVNLTTLYSEADVVFGGGGPNSNSVKSKIDQIDKANKKNDRKKATEAAFNAVRFVFQKFKGPQPLAGTPEQVAQLITHIFCFAGLDIVVEDPFNANLIDPSSQTQVVTSADNTAGTQLPPDAITEPTILEFKKLPNAATITRLDQYPGFYAITASSASNSGPAAPVVVAICPSGAIPPNVRARLRLGHQKTSGFEITPPADASFLDCPTSTASASALPKWIGKALSLVMPKALYAAAEPMFFGGVGGTASEFSPFAPVDIELSFAGGVGGTAGEFKKSGPTKPGITPTDPTRTFGGSMPSIAFAPGTMASIVLPCAALETVWGTQLPEECRPGVVVRTHNGTLMRDVPVAWTVTGGSGAIASETPVTQACDPAEPVASGVTDSTADTTAGAQQGRSAVCWKMGPTPGTNTLRATPFVGGDAPDGVTFAPVVGDSSGIATTTATSVIFTAEAIKATPVVAISCPASVVYNNFDQLPCGSATVTDPIHSLSLGTVPVAYGPTTPPHAVGTYTVDASFAETTLYFAASDHTTFDITPTVPDVSLARRLFAGEYATCALGATSATWCWGSNRERILGAALASTAVLATPSTVGFVPGLSEFGAGSSQHACGITPALSAVCWGRGGFGQLGGGVLGDGAGEPATAGNPPVTVVGGISWASLSTGRLSTCGVSATGVGYCWGANQQGEVGNSSQPLPDSLGQHSATSPLLVDGGLSFRTIVTGWLHACGLTTSGDVYCWGANSFGQLGTGAVGPRQRSPVPIAGTKKFIQLSVGAQHSCGITTDFEAYCWGANAVGQLGNGSTTPTATPTPVAGSLNFRYIATSSAFGGISATSLPTPPVDGRDTHTCALTSVGEAYCWGSNTSGQLGDGGTASHLTPSPVAGGLAFSSIMLGGGHTCARNANAIWCWGSNELGQLGIGTTSNSLTPALVASPFNVP